MNKRKYYIKNTCASTLYRCCTILRLRKCEIICSCFFTKLNFLFLCTPIDKTTQKNFTKLNFLFLCTPIDKTTQKNFTKLNFLFLCTPIDKTTQKNFYKIKFSYLCTPLT